MVDLAEFFRLSLLNTDGNGKTPIVGDSDCPFSVISPSKFFICIVCRPFELDCADETMELREMRFFTYFWRNWRLGLDFSGIIASKVVPFETIARSLFNSGGGINGWRATED